MQERHSRIDFKVWRVLSVCDNARAEGFWWQSRTQWEAVVQLVWDLYPRYLLQPVIGSTAPFRGCLKVIMTDTGHVTMRTRDSRMARMGTRKIPRRTHCMERQRGGGYIDTPSIKAYIYHKGEDCCQSQLHPGFLTFHRAEICSSVEIHITGQLSRKAHTTALIVCAAHNEALQADCQSPAGADYRPRLQQQPVGLISHIGWNTAVFL